MSLLIQFTFKNKGFAHIEFQNHKSVDKSLKLAGTIIDGRKIRIDFPK